MPRTKKTVSKTKAKEDTVLLSEETVFNMLQFASNYYDTYAGNPLLINNRMKDVTLSPVIATAEGIDKALENPKNSETQLVGYSEFLELTSMLYKRVILYLSGMLSFDLTYTCINTTKESDYKSKAYKDDVARVIGFLDAFDIKKEFKTAIRQMVRNEIFFSVLRDEGDKYSLQELPKDYCVITGRWDYGLLFDFDMNWFMQGGVDINMYPPVFKKMYEKAFGKKIDEKKYKPSAPVGERDTAWVKWVQTSPKDNFWGFKFNPEIATKIPFLAPMFPDVAIQPIIRKLQTNSYMASASKLLVGKVPMLDKSVKGASVKDSVAITPDMLGKFLALLKSGLADVVKVGAAPLEDMQGVSFPLDTPFYQDYLKTTTSSSGVNSRLIYTLDKNNAIESQLSINVDEFLMTYVYPQFSDFLEYHINKLTKKYKFKFTMEGTEFFTNRKERLDTQMTLAAVGIVLPQKIAASIGMLPHIFERQLMEGRASGFVDNLTPLMNAMMVTGGKPQAGGKVGRPQSADNNLSDSAEQTRTDGGNIEKGGDE
jgi:hypothetical protein